MENHLKKKVGFFGGTFDPLHFGHLNLSIEIQEKHHLDEVMFCPANCSPEKKHIPPIEEEHRGKMISLGINKIPSFSVSTLELERPGISYTIETIRILKNKYPDIEFYLILGEDTLQGLSKWKEVEELILLAPPLIGTRLQKNIPLLSEKIKEKIRKGMTPISAMEISSTKLRDRLKKRLFCGHLVPSEVLDYIYQNQLYL